MTTPGAAVARGALGVVEGPDAADGALAADSLPDWLAASAAPRGGSGTPRVWGVLS
jgi:hypothetical protein